MNPISGGELSIGQGIPLYDMPILVSGSSNGIGEADEKYRETRRASAEFIVNLLAQSEHEKRDAAGDDQFLIKSFFSNKETVRTSTVLPHMFDDQTGIENTDTFGEDCYDYCAIGVSTVAIPERIIMSYAVGQIIDKLLGSPAVKAAVVADGIVRNLKNGAQTDAVNGAASSTYDKVNRLNVPSDSGIKGFDLKPMGGVQANSTINTMLINGRDVDSKLIELCRLARPGNVAFDIDAIRDGTAATQYKNALGLDKFKSKAFQDSEEWLTSQEKEFEKRAKLFMIEHGPRSFICLCKGVGPDGETFDGLLARLNKLEDPVDRAEKIRAAKSKTDNLQAKMNGLLGRISNWLGHHVETWHTQFVQMRTNLVLYTALDSAASEQIRQMRSVGERIGKKVGVLNSYACVVKEEMLGEENALAMDSGFPYG